MSGVDIDGRIAAATRASGVIWVRPDRAEARAGKDLALWHLWHAGHVYLVIGGAEQAGTGLAQAGRARVVVRDKGQVIAWHAAVGVVAPGGQEWDDVVPLLHAKRLNARDGDEQPRRWARESTVLRLTPTGDPGPTPGSTTADEQVVTV